MSQHEESWTKIVNQIWISGGVLSFRLFLQCAVVFCLLYSIDISTL